MNTGKLLTYFDFRLNAGLYSINAFRQRPFTSVGTRSLLEPSGIQSALNFSTYRCTFLNITNIGSTVSETTDVSPGVGVVCAGEFVFILFGVNVKVSDMNTLVDSL